MEDQYALEANVTADIFPNVAICGHDGRESMVADSVWMVAVVIGIMLALCGGGAGIL